MTGTIRAKRFGQTTPKPPEGSVRDFIERNINEGTPEAFWETAKGLKDRYGPVAKKYLEMAMEAAKKHNPLAMGGKPKEPLSPIAPKDLPAYTALIRDTRGYMEYINKSGKVINDLYAQQQKMIKAFNRIKTIDSELHPYIQKDKILLNEQSGDYMNKLGEQHTELKDLVLQCQGLVEKAFESLSVMPTGGNSTQTPVRQENKPV